MTAESVSSPVAPNAGRNRCSTSSADIAPPPPWPIWIVGESSSGSGQLHAAMSTGAASGRLSTSATAVHQLQPPVLVIRRAGALGADHRGAERVARGALAAERGALVRLDQPLQHLPGAADGGLLGVD